MVGGTLVGVMLGLGLGLAGGYYGGGIGERWQRIGYRNREGG